MLRNKGEYTISLQSGVYNITASKIGYNSETIPYVTVKSYGKISLDFHLTKKR